MFPEESSIPEVETRWGLGDAALGWFIAVGAQFGALVMAMAMTLDGQDPAVWSENLSMREVALMQVPLDAVLLAWPLIISRSKGRGAGTDFGLSLRVGDLPMGIAIGIGAQIASMLLYIPVRFLMPDSDVGEVARDLAEKADDPLGVVLLFLVVGLMAPIAEEVFYRGLVLRSIEKRHGGRAALWGSALVFAVAHFQVLQFPGLLWFGLVAGYLVQRYGRLGPAIAAHIGFNSIVVAILVFA